MTTVTPLPSTWFQGDPFVGQECAVRAMLRNPMHPLVAVVRHTPHHHGALLAAGLRAAIGHHGMFSYPAEYGAVHATAMLAAWIGFEPEAVHEDLGGTVTVVRSGLGHRDDQKWHTDSTPWSRPNRLTLLGQIHLADGHRAPPTELLPLAAVDDALSAYPDVLQSLRSIPVPWRQNFPEWRQFAAPILAVDPPRWVGSVLEQCMAELPASLQSAVEVFRSIIADLPHVKATVDPGRLLIFDNHANLHRGPQIEQHLERTLIRIKIGGAP